MVRRHFSFGIIVLLLTGCSATKFSSKTDVLAKSSVFGMNIGQEDRDDLSDDVTRELNQGPADETMVTLMCSDSRSEAATNFKRALADNLPVQLNVGFQSCTTNPQAIRSLILKDKITRADLAAVCPGALPAAGKALALSVINDKSVNMQSNGKLTVLYARNQDKSVPAEAADADCDRNSSPLVIHMASNPLDPRPIALSSQDDGVDFDLLGARNGHQAVRISWFTNMDYRFLALPDSGGQVNGVDQLFGDNTRGPDGEFADNGYAALAKFDGTTSDGMFQVAAPDGRIDSKDPIFKKLRLWLDMNLDGRGDAREMTSLRRANIAYIDLEYSSDYAETDRYGNETKMKSVVGYNDGSLDLIFDLWFRYNLPGGAR